MKKSFVFRRECISCHVAVDTRTFPFARSALSPLSLANNNNKKPVAHLIKKMFILFTGKLAQKDYKTAQKVWSSRNTASSELNLLETYFVYGV